VKVDYIWSMAGFRLSATVPTSITNRCKYSRRDSLAWRARVLGIP